MPFIGNTPQNQSFAPAIDYFSGNGVTVTFTLSRPVASVAQVIVAIDNVIQNPSSAFTVSGNSITFTSAPLSGTNNIWVEYTSLITTYAAISQDPSVIGDITATGGFLAEGDFGNSYIDGTIVDYVTGNARITTGPIDDMTFYHGGTSGRSEMMRLSYAGNSYIVGNLGVNTTSPSARLQVAGGDIFVSTVGNKVNFATTGSSTVNYVGGAADGYSLEMACQRGANQPIAYKLDFANGHIWSTAGSERMRIDTSGNVGIGTSSSGNKFEVAGSGMFSGAVTTNTTGTHISYQSGNSQIGAWGPDTSTNGTLVFFSARSNGVNGLERMRIDSNGNLIMASNAGYLQLPTNQTMRVPSTGGIGYVGNINSATVFQIAYNSTSAGVQLSSGATSWGTFSDSRLKNITGTYTNALNDIAQIEPVKFTWKSDEGNKPQVGVVAQSVQNVVPEAVDSTTIEMDGTEEYLTVRYTELIPLMIASIQELKAEVDSLKAQLEAK